MIINKRDVKDSMKRVYYRVSDEARLLATRFGGKECNTVCLCLGPYRNLTTLTGSILFLHPNVQVLNHAGRRIFDDDRIDFLSDYSDDTLRRFMRFAIWASSGGEKAEWGGSIVHSHAFERSSKLRALFRESEMGRVKRQIDCLFWKESLRVSKHLRENDKGNQVLESNDTVRVLMPIRNPLDCVKSNIKTGHHLLFSGIDSEAGERDVLRSILEEFSWYSGIKNRFPDKSFHFFEYEMGEEILREMARFLGLEENEKWVEQAVSIMDSKSQYQHSNDFVEYYRDCLDDLSFEDESLREGLLRFCP